MVKEEVSEKRMLPFSYRIIHPNTELSDNEIAMITKWAGTKKILSQVKECPSASLSYHMNGEEHKDAIAVEKIRD